MSGRELFMFNPAMAENDDADAADDRELHEQANQNALAAAETNVPTSLEAPKIEEQSEESDGTTTTTNTNEPALGGVQIDASLFTGEDVDFEEVDQIDTHLVPNFGITQFYFIGK